MDLHGVRYLFEHKLLPQWFYEKKIEFIGISAKNKKFLYEVFNSICEEEEVDNPYDENDIFAELFGITEKYIGMIVKMPEPEEEPLCYCMLMIFDDNFDKSFYYTIEKGNADSGNLPFICGWDSKGVHLNFGGCGLDEEENIKRCISLFMKNEYGATLKDMES